MSTFDDSSQPYNDKFSFSKNTEKILFNPNKPLFQSELNELQSLFAKQIQVGNDTNLDNGTVMSGMGLIPKGVIDPSETNYFNNSDKEYSIMGTGVSNQITPLDSYTLKVPDISAIDSDINFSIDYDVKGVISAGSNKNNFGSFTIGFNQYPLVMRKIDLSTDSLSGTIECTIKQDDIIKNKSQANELILSMFKISNDIQVTLKNPSMISAQVIKGNPNTLSYNTFSAINSRLDTNNYALTGAVGITSEVAKTTDNSGISLGYTTTNAGDSTLSFYLTRTNGTLINFGIISGNSINVSKVVVDSSIVTTDITKPSTYGKGGYLVDNKGNSINLTDGNAHKVSITLSNVPQGSNNVSLAFNVGLDISSTHSFGLRLNRLKMEYGDNVTAWNLSPQDQSIATSGIRNKIITITNGIVYANGMFRNFDSQQITISGKGKEKIGMKLNSFVITANQDNSLIDDTNGTPSYGKSGADRLRYSIDLTYNEDTAIPLYTLQDGEIVYSSKMLNSLNDILARRTNDEAGSYRVSGFNIWGDSYNKLDSSKIDLFVDYGVAYVEGYQVEKNKVSTVLLDTSTENSGTLVDNLQYNPANPSWGILSNQPVQNIVQVVAQVQVLGEAVSRRSSGPDNLANKDILSISKIISGNTTYLPDNGLTGDYRLSNNQIIWNIHPGSNSPAVGTTYYVDYIYNATLNTSEYTTSVTGNTTSISITGNGRVPVENTGVQAYYTSFLAREDTVMLDKLGNISIVKGQPLPLQEVHPVWQQDPVMLRLGYVIVYPNSPKVKFIPNVITRTTEQGIQANIQNIQQLQYDMSIIETKLNAMTNQDPQTLAGTFGDDFSTTDKADINNQSFNIYYDIDDNGESSITIPNSNIGVAPIQIDKTNTTASLSEMDATIPYSVSTWLSQPYATGSQNINPYDIFNVSGSMKLIPATDSWVDGKTIERWNPDTHAYTSQHQNGLFSPYSTTQETTTTDSFSTKDTVIEYARPRTVKFYCDSLEPNTTGYLLTLDGKYLDNTTGGANGVFTSDAEGKISGTFTIPENTIRTGTREVIVKNPNNIASTTYYSRGTLETTDILRTRHYYTTTTYDPIAQSFMNDKARSIANVKVYFKTKEANIGSQNKSNVELQVRATNNAGDITNEILGTKTLTYKDINVSDDASIATNFIFDSPIQLDSNTMYAFVIVSPTDIYELFYAKAGEKKVNDHIVLDHDAYPAGMMFQSSNQFEWTKVQDKDLKFDIGECNFADNATLQYLPIDSSSTNYPNTNTNLTFTKMTLQLLQATPGSSSVEWQFRYKYAGDTANLESKAWQTLTPAIPFIPTDKIASFQIRAKLTSNDSGLSPDIYLDSVSPVCELSGNGGCYVSRSIDMSQYPFNNLAVSYEAYIPTNTYVNVLYSTDNGNTWNPLTNLVSTVNSSKYIKYDYKALLADSSKGNNQTFNSIKLKVVLLTDNNLVRPHVKRLTSSEGLV